MTLPSIELRQGASLDGAIALLRTLAANCYNDARPAAASGPPETRDAFVRWATQTETQLIPFFTNIAAASFFVDPRHRDICSMTPGTQLIPMINAEIAAHSERFRVLAEEMEMARNLFDGAGRCLLPDTSFFIEHAEKIEDLNFHELAGSTGPVRVLIPMVVVDELDSLKKSGSRRVRWRAGYALAVIDRLIGLPPWPGVLRPEQYSPPRGQVTFQIVLDPKGHKRLPINDDEIVDRGLACQPFAENLTVFTYDTGQSTRARAAGLEVEKLSHDLGEEPEEPL